MKWLKKKPNCISEEKGTNLPMFLSSKYCNNFCLFYTKHIFLLHQISFKEHMNYEVNKG